MFLREKQIVNWIPLFNPNKSIREDPFEQGGQIHPPKNPYCLQNHDDHPFHDTDVFMQSVQRQDTISNRQLSSVPIDSLAASTESLSNNAKTIENYEAIPDTRVLANEAKSSCPTRSIRTTKASLHGQEKTSYTKTARHSIVQHKYRDVLSDLLDELLRFLPVQRMGRYKGA